MWRIQHPVGHLPLLATEAELLNEHCSVLLVLPGLSHDLNENLGLSSAVLRASKFCSTRQFPLHQPRGPDTWCPASYTGDS